MYTDYNMIMSVFLINTLVFTVIYVYGRFMGVPLQLVNKLVFTVILLKVH